MAGGPVRGRLDRRRPAVAGRGLGRQLLQRLLAGAGTERAWLVTHDLGTPARALYRSLGFRELGRAPLGWHDAERVVLGATLPPTARSPTRQPDPPGTRRPDPPASGPSAGDLQPNPPVPGPPVGEATSPAE